MTVQVLDPRVDAEPVDWPDFLVRRALPPVWTFELLRLESWLSRNPPVLTIVRDAGEIVAAAVTMVCRSWWESHYADRPTVHTRRMRPRWADAYLPALGGHPAVVFASELAVDDRRAALRSVERALSRYLGIGLLGVVYRVVESAVLPVVTGPGRLVRPTLATTVLRNRWSDVDGWLASLGRERRQGLRRYARKFERDRSLAVELGAGRTDVDAPELATLLAAHQRRLGTPAFDHRTPLAGAYLDAFVRRPDVYTLTYRDAGTGRLLGFNTLIDHPRSPVLHHWAALPVNEGGRYNLYFDCYLRCVRHMIEQQREELFAGRGLLDVKTSLGFVPEPRYAIVAPRPVIGR